MAAVPFVDVDAAGFDPGQRLQPGDDRPQRVAVEGGAVQRLGVEHELAALGARDWGDDTDLAAELVGRAGLTLADAFDLRGM